MSSDRLASLLAQVPNVPPCDSKIWGHGPLLDTIQRARLFTDSKTFVDLRLIYDPDTVLENFEKLGRRPEREELKKFVRENFSMEQDQEFEEWDPEDWVPKPEYLKSLKQKTLIYIGLEVNKLWNILSQKCSKDLEEHPEQFSKVILLIEN